MRARHAPELPIDQLPRGCMGHGRAPMTWGHPLSDKKSREVEAPQHAGARGTLTVTLYSSGPTRA